MIEMEINKYAHTRLAVTQCCELCYYYATNASPRMRICLMYLYVTLLFGLIRFNARYNITALFLDGGPAQIEVALGKGRVTYAAYHPGLAYMHPAM